MIPVYIAENELDAQLVQELLVTSGIAAHIFGPNVVDAAAATATPQIRVVVENEEADEARRLVHEWQTVPALDVDDDEGDLLLDSAPLDGAADDQARAFDLDLDFDIDERRH